jgi:hypothetical protein
MLMIKNMMRLQDNAKLEIDIVNKDIISVTNR